MIHTYTHECKCTRCDGWFSFVVTDPVGPTSTTGFACPDCSVVLNEGMARQQRDVQNIYAAGLFPGGIGAVKPGQWIYSGSDRVNVLETKMEKLEGRVTSTVVQTNERIDDLDETIRDNEALATRCRVVDRKDVDELERRCKVLHQTNTNQQGYLNKLREDLRELDTRVGELE